MIKYLPINLNVKNKKCLVIGGGHVARRKVNRLLECGAKVVVISPEIVPGLRKKGVRWIKSAYKTKYIAGAYLVFAATNDPKVNSRVARDCRNKGIIINVVDRAAESDFISPAILRQRNLVIAVSTDGRAPVRSQRVRDELKTYRFKS